MSIGTNIKSLREERKLTQEQVAESLGITFQAVSSWERDEYKPDIVKLMRLAELFDVSVSAIVEEKRKTFKAKETIYNWEHMKTYVKTTARNFKLKDTLMAVDYAVEAHQGQIRKKSKVPYIYHPVSFSEIESPSLLVRRGSLSLLRGRKSNLVRIQQARHPSRRIRWWRSAS